MPKLCLGIQVDTEREREEPGESFIERKVPRKEKHTNTPR